MLFGIISGIFDISFIFPKIFSWSEPAESGLVFLWVAWAKTEIYLSIEAVRRGWQVAAGSSSGKQSKQSAWHGNLRACPAPKPLACPAFHVPSCLPGAVPGTALAEASSDPWPTGREGTFRRSVAFSGLPQDLSEAEKDFSHESRVHQSFHHFFGNCLSHDAPMRRETRFPSSERRFLSELSH